MFCYILKFIAYILTVELLYCLLVRSVLEFGFIIQSSIEIKLSLLIDIVQKKLF